MGCGCSCGGRKQKVAPITNESLETINSINQVIIPAFKKIRKKKINEIETDNEVEQAIATLIELQKKPLSPKEVDICVNSFIKSKPIKTLQTLVSFRAKQNFDLLDDKLLLSKIYLEMLALLEIWSENNETLCKEIMKDHGGAIFLEELLTESFKGQFFFDHNSSPIAKCINYYLIILYNIAHFEVAKNKMMKSLRKRNYISSFIPLLQYTRLFFIRPFSKDRVIKIPIKFNNNNYF